MPGSVAGPVAVLGTRGQTGRHVCTALSGRAPIRAVLHRDDTYVLDVAETAVADLTHERLRTS